MTEDVEKNPKEGLAALRLRLNALRCVNEAAGAQPDIDRNKKEY